MAESIINKLPQSAVNNFTTKTNAPVVKMKKQAKVFADIETNQINMLLLGPWGTGKTLFIVGLLLHGHKVFCLSTDFGGSGLISVRNELKELGRQELESNLIELTLDTYEEVMEFLEKPEVFFPQFYTFGHDVMFWDGMDNFQQSHVNDYVGEMVPERKNGVTEAREAGLQFETSDWGLVRSATLKALNRFFKLHNKKDGTVFHKVVTSKAKVIQKKIGDTQQFVEVFEPNLSGASRILLGAAFSLVLLTKVVKGKSGKEYKYVVYDEGVNTCKNRGFKLPLEMEADSYALWNQMCTQLGIKKGNKDSSLVEN